MLDETLAEEKTAVCDEVAVIANVKLKVRWNICEPDHHRSCGEASAKVSVCSFFHGGRECVRGSESANRSSRSRCRRSSSRRSRNRSRTLAWGLAGLE